MEKQVTACFKVPEREYRAVRVYAAKEGLGIQEVLVQMLRAWMAEKNITAEGLK